MIVRILCFVLIFLIIASCVVGYDDDDDLRDITGPDFEINEEDIFRRLVEAGVDPSLIHISTDSIPLEEESGHLEGSSEEGEEVFISVDDLLNSGGGLVEIDVNGEGNSHIGSVSPNQIEEESDRWLHQTLTRMVGSEERANDLVSNSVISSGVIDPSSQKPEQVNSESVGSTLGHPVNNDRVKEEKMDVSTFDALLTAPPTVEPHTISSDSSPIAESASKVNTLETVLREADTSETALLDLNVQREGKDNSNYVTVSTGSAASVTVDDLTPEFAKLQDRIGALEVERDNLKAALETALNSLEESLRNATLLETKARLAKNEKNMAQLTLENCRLHAEVSQHEHEERVKDLMTELFELKSTTNAKRLKDDCLCSAAKSNTASPGTGRDAQSKEGVMQTGEDSQTRGSSNNHNDTQARRHQPGPAGSSSNSYNDSAVTAWWSFVRSTLGKQIDGILEYIAIRYENEDENSYFVKIIDLCIDIYFFVESCIHRPLYMILNYYDSEDLWIRIYLSIVDFISFVFESLNSLGVFLDDHVLAPLLFTTAPSIPSLFISKGIVFGIAGIPFIIYRRYVVGIGAAFLMILLSPILLLVSLATKLMQLFQKKASKEPKKKKSRKSLEAVDGAVSDTSVATSNSVPAISETQPQIPFAPQSTGYPHGHIANHFVQPPAQAYYPSGVRDFPPPPTTASESGENQAQLYMGEQYQQSQPPLSSGHRRDVEPTGAHYGYGHRA